MWFLSSHIRSRITSERLTYANLTRTLLLFSCLGYETIGCYRDTSNRAIEPLEGKDSILDGAYWTRKNPIAKCAQAARRAGYGMFAIQNGGWCAASATAVKTFNKYGKSAACRSDGEGGPWANQVYVIKGKLKYLPCDKEDLNNIC